MPARLVNIRDSSLALPEFLGLDASIILAINTPPGIKPSSHIVPVRAFWTRISTFAQRNRIVLVLPQLAFEECCFKLCQYHFEELARFEGTGIKWHEYYKRNPNQLRAVHPTLLALYQNLTAIPVLITEPEDLTTRSSFTSIKLTERALDLIHAFALLPKDATLLSEFERFGIDTVATLDADWQRADGFTVITTV